MPTLALPTPHPGQLAWIDHPERFLVVAAGTKAGKTFGAVLWLLREAWTQPEGVYWWVAPVYPQARIAYRLMRRMLSRIRGPKGQRMPFRAVDGDLWIGLPNGSRIEFKSAEKPDNLFGEGVSAAVFDEASRAREDAWNALLTTLTFTAGRCLLIANAKGKKNFFYRLYLKGRDPDEPEFAAFRQPSTANPWLRPAVIETAKRTLPADVFRELYDAEFLDDAAAVFRGYTECVAGHWEPPRPGRYYVIGADFARWSDWSVFVAVDVAARHVVHITRTQGGGWSEQVDALVELAESYNGAEIYGDATHGSVGDPICETLQDRGCWVEPVQFTNASKRDLVVRTQGVIEREEFTFPEYAPLLDELDVFGLEVTAMGNVRYSAPSGYHDDCVMALCLAVYGMEQGSEVVILGEE